MNKLKILFILDHPKISIIEIEESDKFISTWLIYDKKNEIVKFFEFVALNSFRQNTEKLIIGVFKGKALNDNKYVIELEKEDLNFKKIPPNSIPFDVQHLINFFIKERV